MTGGSGATTRAEASESGLGSTPRARCARAPQGPVLTPLLVRVAPRPLEGQAPGVGGDELVDRLRAPGARLVEAEVRRGVEQLRRHLPEPLDAVGGGEQGAVAAHRVEDQRS